MKPEDLQAVLEANDAEGCITLFARATEAERRAVAKTAAARLRAVTADVSAQLMPMIDAVPEAYIRQFCPSYAMNRGGLRVAQVAVLATATLRELKTFAVRCLPPVEDSVAVLSARRPPWVGEWVEAILAWQGSGQWPLVRRLIREGLCDRPRSPQYIHAMIGAIYHFGLSHGVHAVLLDDPGLLDDEIWEIFQTEPERGRLNLLPIDAATPAQARWELALAELADEGRLSRSRLLDASLGGLERDFHEVRARWFALLHEALRPTLDERAERAVRYLGLLSSRNRTTVTFAVEALAELEKVGRLDPRSARRGDRPGAAGPCEGDGRGRARPDRPRRASRPRVSPPRRGRGGGRPSPRVARGPSGRARFDRAPRRSVRRDAGGPAAGSRGDRRRLATQPHRVVAGPRASRSRRPKRPRPVSTTYWQGQRLSTLSSPIGPASRRRSRC